MNQVLIKDPALSSFSHYDIGSNKGLIRSNKENPFRHCIQRSKMAAILLLLISSPFQEVKERA